MKRRINLQRLIGASLCAAVLLFAALPADAAPPPVRIAVVGGGGSGQEQSAADQIAAGLSSNPDVVLSTVNPDWYVVCNIVEQPDIVAGNVKVNGTVLIKTTDGQVINTVSVQTNKQDFSLQPGAPLNKAMVDSAVREVIAGMADRASGPLQDAVKIEMSTRDYIINAQMLADKDQYGEAISTLQMVSPDSPHFKAVRSLIDEYRMEQDALQRVNEAKDLAAHGKYMQAINVLQGVSPKSKRHALAKQRIAAYRAALNSHRSLAKNKPAAPNQPNVKSSAADLRLKALESQKTALEAQKKAIEAQEAALKARSAK